MSFNDVVLLGEVVDLLIVAHYISIEGHLNEEILCSLHT